MSSVCIWFIIIYMPVFAACFDSGTRFKEGCNINRSLFTLGQVIKKLSDESQKYESHARFALINYLVARRKSNSPKWRKKSLWMRFSSQVLFI